MVCSSRGLFDISATSSAQLGAQQIILPIFPPKPELENMSNNGFIYTLYKSALSALLDEHLTL